MAERSKRYFEDASGTHPAVGAVITDSNWNVIAKASRSEDIWRKKRSHAEIIALRRLVRNKRRRLPHAIVTTLEPCSLRHGADAISCARRVVRSGIDHVIIGCLDPGIGVRGRGAHLLQTSGIYFTMFPEELKDLVLKYNTQYLKGQKWETYNPRYTVKDIKAGFATFDLEKAPSGSRNFLNSRKFQIYVAGLFERYRQEFDDGSIEWEHYFASYAARSQILEKARLNTEDKTVFEELAVYLAVPRKSPDEHASVYLHCGGKASIESGRRKHESKGGISKRTPRTSRKLSLPLFSLIREKWSNTRISRSLFLGLFTIS